MDGKNYLAPLYKPIYSYATLHPCDKKTRDKCSVTHAYQLLTTLIDNLVRFSIREKEFIYSLRSARRRISGAFVTDLAIDNLH